MTTRCRRWTMFLLLIGLIMLVTAWRDASGTNINPRYVSRIKDGVTTKNEIMLLFGEPQEVQRVDNMVVFSYRSYQDATPPSMRQPLDREVSSQSTHPFYLDDDKNIKVAGREKKQRVLKSSLIVRFKPDGQTVQSHEYQEHGGGTGKAPGK